MNSIRFNLKDPKEEESLILLVYRYEGKKFVTSTKEHVLTKYWNHDSMSVRKVNAYPDHVRINASLRHWRDALSKAWGDFQIKSKIPTKLELKKKTLEYRYEEDSSSGSDNLNVISVLEKFINQARTTGRLKKGTLLAYDQLLNSLKTFKDGRSLELSDLGLDRLKAFIAHLWNQDYSKGQVNKLQNKLVALLNDCKDNQMPVNDAYKSSKWRVGQPRSSKSKVVLTKEEVRKIENIELPEKWDKVRDRFLIGLYTGQRFSDFIRFSQDTVQTYNGKDYLHFTQKKTKSELKIPTTEKIESIFNKYDGYPPTMTAPHFNRTIKKIAEEAGITQEVKQFREYKDGMEEITSKKCDLITSHVCRRTFVTLALSKGLSPGEVMKISGHSNLEMLSKYIGGDLDSLINSETYKDIFN
jgi:integrase